MHGRKEEARNRRRDCRFCGRTRQLGRPFFRSRVHFQEERRSQCEHSLAEESRFVGGKGSFVLRPCLAKDLGKGSNGSRVYSALNLDTGGMMAVKECEVDMDALEDTREKVRLDTVFIKI